MESAAIATGPGSGARRGIIAALAVEARPLLRRATPATRVYVSGVGPSAARTAARQAVADGCNLLVSWGTACGLDPSLGAGQLILADRIWSEGWRHASREWFHDTRARLDDTLEVCVGPLAGTGGLLRSPGSKAELRTRSGARAADMESAAVAEVAERSRMPWLSVRVILDEASLALPEVLERAVEPDGCLALRKLCVALGRRPGELADLWRLALRYRRARASLASAADALGW